MTSEKPARPLVEPTAGEKLQTWYDRNATLINIVLLVLVVGVVSFKLYGFMQDRNIAKANMAYGSALNQYQTAQSNPDAAAKKDQLGGVITAAEQVAAEHKNQFVGRDAQLLIGNAQYALGTEQAGTPEAVKSLEKARDSYRKYIDIAATPQEKAAGHLALGNVLENLSFIQNNDKVMQEAIDSYKQALAASEGTYLGTEVKLSLARALSTLKNEKTEAEAAKYYQEVAKSGDESLLSADAIKPVETTLAKTEGGPSPEVAKELLNFTKWSHKQQAEDALARLK